MKFSIIIVNYNSTEYIIRLIKSIYSYLSDLEYEIIVVDNNSPNRDIESLEKENKNIKVVFLKKNYGFGYANNRGMEIAKYDYFFLLNPDTFFTDNSVKLMMNKMLENQNWGIVGPMVKYENGNIQESALHFMNIRYQVYHFLNILDIVIRYSKKFRRKIFGNREYETDYLFGSCMLIRRSLHEQIGGFDEDYFLFAEEADYCYRTKFKTKFKNIYFPKSLITHIAGVITNKEPLERIYQNYNSKLIFIIKNYRGIYAFILRYVIILLFIKNTIASYIFNKEKFRLNKKVYYKIISIYYNNKPQLNNS